MKCTTIACIWSAAPPVHRVTAATVLGQPPTLYTGGSDGSIVWWNLFSSQYTQEIKPIAMLCGHTAPIADLGICFPASVSGEGKINDSSNVVSNSNLDNTGALISACTDGVLCVWSRTSGNCRRRRKLPPWVGRPSTVRPLPGNQRYVCIACCFVDFGNLSGHNLPDPVQGAEPLLDKDSQFGNSRCTIVIVDSYTLSIVQTVFHGNVSTGPLKSMTIVSSVGDTLTQSVMLVDYFGKVQYIPIYRDTEPNMENISSKHSNSSHLQIADWEYGSKDTGLVVAFANCGQVLAIIFREHCLFRLVDNGTILGEISFLDDHVCLEGNSNIINGMFLRDYDSRIMPNTGKSGHEFGEEFAVWNNRGSAVIYWISYSKELFQFEPLYVIPAILHPPNSRFFVCFLQLNNCLLRVDSVGLHKEEILLGKPTVTIWLLPQQHDRNKKLLLECKRLGEGRFLDDWLMNFTQETGMKAKGKEDDLMPSVPKHLANLFPDNHGHGFQQKGQLVSSSMVISEDYDVPFAIVYGFCNGDIQVVFFDMIIEELGSHFQSPATEADSISSTKYLSGHAGAVLCLASHRLVNTSRGQSFYHLLLSGSMDCTVRLWDLDSGNPITVLHHHVAPVRQIVLPPPQTERPWSDCFLSVGEDFCVALTSLDTLRVERMFPGHPYYPEKAVWDSTRGYLACLCKNHSGASDASDVLYIWDVKTGARERVLRGAAANSMFDHFCMGVNKTILPGNMMLGNTSASSLLLPLNEETRFSKSHLKISENATSPSNISPFVKSMSDYNTSTNVTIGSAVESIPSTMSVVRSNRQPIKCSCPLPGIATLSFDLTLLMSLSHKQESLKYPGLSDHGTTPSSTNPIEKDGNSDGISGGIAEDDKCVKSFEKCLLQFSLAFLHLWNVDHKLDSLLVSELKLKRPENFLIASGLIGDRGSVTLTFPGSSSTLELWKSSSEYSAIRSLTMVSLAQHMIGLSHSYSIGSSALSAFYMRNFAEKIPDIRPPSLELLVSFWQDEFEHVKMAARSLFHCAASRAIPHHLCRGESKDLRNFIRCSNGVAESDNENLERENAEFLASENKLHAEGNSQARDSEILSWLESFEIQDWISCVGGTSQDAMTSRIIVAAALAVWYPSLVKPNLAFLVVHPLVKLVMAMNEKYSSTAAEILAEGIASTWKECIGSEIPRLIADIFFQIECVSGTSANASAKSPPMCFKIRETLVEVLLPSLAMADIQSFLNVIESHVWSTASDSPVHVVSLVTLIRMARGCARILVQFLDKVVTFILQTMDPSNPVMRKTCLQSSMAALKEVVRVFPMVALSDTSTRLAVGDAIVEINTASIRVYDMQSITKVKVLDASGPPGLPTLLGGASEVGITTAISALSFSPDGEGLVAFSENGLMIRWWSLGSVWWEKLTRNLTPVQCTKLIFVPPWEGFSPNSSRSSIMASVMSSDGETKSQEATKTLNDADRLKLLVQNLDLSYRLEWAGGRKVKLIQHGRDLGTFQL